MSLTVIRPGAQASIQAGPFAGQRHFAIPAAGAADPLSLALANRLVGRPADAAAVEITLGGAALEFDTAMRFAVTGAEAIMTLNGRAIETHRTLSAAANDRLDIGAMPAGCRCYLAVSRPLAIPAMLGRASTLMVAGIGGLEGRPLRAGDSIPTVPETTAADMTETPKDLRPYIGAEHMLRVVAGAEADWAGEVAGREWEIGRGSSRMGMQLEGPPIALKRRDSLKSGAVFPGTIQCPPSGLPYLLGVDGQTSGGYPRLAQVIRADRHLIGQLGPGQRVRLQAIDADEARAIYRAKLEAWRDWLPDLKLS